MVRSSWCISEQGYQNTNINQSSQNEDGQPADLLDHKPEADRGESIKYTVANDDTTNNVNSVSTGHKTLKMKL